MKRRISQPIGYLQGFAAGVSMARQHPTLTTEALLKVLEQAPAEAAATLTLAQVRRRGRPPGAAKSRAWAQERVLFIWILRRLVVHGMTKKAACEWLRARGVRLSRATMERRFKSIAKVFGRYHHESGHKHEEFLKIEVPLLIERLQRQGRTAKDLELEGDLAEYYEKFKSPLPRDPSLRESTRVK